MRFRCGGVYPEPAFVTDVDTHASLATCCGRTTGRCGRSVGRVAPGEDLAGHEGGVERPREAGVDRGVQDRLDDLLTGQPHVEGGPGGAGLAWLHACRLLRVPDHH